MRRRRVAVDFRQNRLRFPQQRVVPRGFRVVAGRFRVVLPLDASAKPLALAQLLVDRFLRWNQCRKPTRVAAFAMPPCCSARFTH